jgi:hypothetical protein
MVQNMAIPPITKNRIRGSVKSRVNLLLTDTSFGQIVQKSPNMQIPAHFCQVILFRQVIPQTGIRHSFF